MSGEGVDDLAQLAELKEGSLLSEIHYRYDRALIYTYIGDILVAVNPYQRLPIYGPQKWEEYREIRIRSQLPPHIYAVSDAAYQNMLNNQIDQCCVVSGESGAGKTESTKLLIEHIAQLCRHGETSDLHSRIVQVNPLLEAFGNAQTVINNNSSRFGKFIELVFDGNGSITGARLSEYLLEKSRVVQQSPGERNFHIFYYLFAGLQPEELQANYLNNPENHRIVRPANGEAIYPDKREQQEHKNVWTTLLGIMKSVGFTDEEIDSILAVLAAILHLTDIEFVEDSDTDGVFIKNEQLPTIVAQLLLVNPDDLVAALISNKSTAGNEDVLSLKNLLQANDGRDALSKALYGRLFGWIVRQINVILEPKSIPNQSSVTIGILDIYGFENFQRNSFEQLCINVTNEQLQYYFNEHIFKSELEEYAREGVPSSDVTFVDNYPLIQLFLETQGILARLDDESKFPQGTDQTFVDKLTKEFSGRPEFQTHKGQRAEFMINHFAGMVTYDVNGFVEKNRDTLSESLTRCMMKSDSKFVVDLFSPVSQLGTLEANKTLTLRRKEWRMSKLLTRESGATLSVAPSVDSASALKRMSAMIREDGSIAPAATGTFSRVTMRNTGGGGDGSTKTIRTLANHFKNSLNDLLVKLTRAQPHFIRCIKPNSEKAAQMFDDKLVLQQLRYTGVLETVRIRQQGYSVRLTFDEFVKRFEVFPPRPGAPDSKTTSLSILKSMNLEGWKQGKTKIFLKYWHMEQLNEAAARVRHQIVMCQAYWRAALARQQYQELKAAARILAEQIHFMSTCTHVTSNQIFEAQQQLCSEDSEIAAEDARSRQTQEGPRNGSAQPVLTRGPTIGPDSTIRPKEDEYISLKAAADKLPPIPELMENPPGFPKYSKDNSTIQVLLDETTIKLSSLSTDIWGKVYYMEKNAIMGKVYLRDWDIVINDSNEPYDGQVIGVNTFDHWGDNESKEAVKNVGEGLLISRDEPGNLYVKRLSRSDIFIKGLQESQKSCFPREALSIKNGRLGTERIKVFDIEEYLRKVREELKKSDCDPHVFNRLSVVRFSFWKDRLSDVETPCWICLINFAAMDLLGKEQILQKMNLKSKDELKLKKLWKSLNYNRQIAGMGEAAFPNMPGTMMRR